MSVLEREHLLVAALADGCGSAPHSEVGAQLGVRVCTAVVERLVTEGVSLASAEFLERCQGLILAELERRVFDLDARALADFGLFTLLCACVSRDTVLLFGLGDGVVACNDRVSALGPFSDDAPPYLAYARLGAAVQLAPLCIADPRELSHFALGTDGALPFMEAWPQVLEAPRLFTHPDDLRRRLWRSRPADDATLLVARTRAT